jgi:predicted ATPase/signal transduction histidine kinase/CheY-like chemotaxis protein
MLNLAGYRFTQEIYRGEKTLVHRGIREADNRPVVAKYLRTDYPTVDETDSLVREYDISLKLDIPGVAEYLSLEDFGHGKVLIIEDFGAISLKDYLLTHTLELPDTLELACSIIDIIASIHQKNIIHKDIKPANILINPEKNLIKLTDFNIAALTITQSTAQVTPEHIKGTLAYISPEQTGRINRNIDYRSDFYSYGVTLYEMLTRYLPFQTRDPMALIHAHCAGKPPSLNENYQIPNNISDIVIKLLAKSADDRYQSAAGIKYDLEQCFEQLKSFSGRKKSHDFILASHDFPERFVLPEKLYGREKEIQFFQNELLRIKRGQPGMILVSGPPGIGKSFLINEIYKSLGRQKGRGYFVSGKFDQFRRNTPYRAIIHAFSGLIKQILSESDTKLAAWKSKILAKTGSSGQVLIDVIPAIELIIGKQPDVPTLSPTESRNRFNLLFKEFCSVFSRESESLIIFLDDLQWSDPASLTLVQMLMVDSEIRNLLFICSYRNNEVKEHHPLMLTIRKIKKQQGRILPLEVQALTKQYINLFLADFLRCKKDKSEELAKLVHEKTGGNPFFINQFLRTLYKKGLLNLEPSLGWQWDPEEIKLLDITDNIVDLLIEKISSFSEKIQSILQVCACIGIWFDLKTLSAITGETKNYISSCLSIAVNDGLFTNQDMDYRFQHDRILDAAYKLVPAKEKKNLHHKIGSYFLKTTSNDELQSKIFFIITHLNHGIDIVSSQKEKDEIANLNLLAGKKAKESTAFSTAAEHFKIGTELLAKDSWKKNYRLTYQLYRERSECEFLCANFELAEQLSNIIIQKAKSNIDLADMYVVKMNLYTSVGKFNKAVDLGITGLKMFGVKLKLRPSRFSILLELVKTRWNRGLVKIEDLIELPEMTDPEQLAVTRMMNAMAAAAFVTDANLIAFLILKGLNIYFRYGNTSFSSFGYTGVGFVIGSISGNYGTSLKYGELALKINEKFDNRQFRCKSVFSFAYFIQPWCKHAKYSIPLLKESYSYGVEAGDLTFAGYAITTVANYRMIIGDNLGDIFLELKTYKNFILEAKDSFSINVYYKLSQFFTTLKGELPGSEQGDIYKSEERFLSDENLSEIFTVLSLEMISAFIFNKYHRCLELASELEIIIEIPQNTLWVVEHAFYYCLTITALYHDADPGKKKKYLKILRKKKKLIKRRARNCPENFHHKYLLIKAETARIKGKNEKAFDYYNQAINSSRKNGYTNIEAVANELAARFQLARGCKRTAKAYINDACFCYEKWGAIGKVEAMQNKYQQLMPQSGEKGHHVTTTNTLTDITSTIQLFDIQTVIKAAQAISSEVIIEQLLAKFIKIMMENAGAQKGVLLIEKQDTLLVEAECLIDQDETELFSSIPIEESKSVPEAIVRLVSRTMESVVLDDASREAMFSDDQYVQTVQPVSVCCIPIIHQDKMAAILYLENNLSRGAFTRQRQDVLALLAAQAAISLNNAFFYTELENKINHGTSQLQQANLDQKQANEDLEKARTVLDCATRTKAEFLANMSHEIRTPLNSIISAAQLTAQELLSERAKRFVEIVNSSGDQLLKLINDILDFSKIEADKVELENQPFILDGLLDLIMESFSPLAVEKYIKFKIELLPETPRALIGDPFRIKQILTNFLDNCLRLTDPGGEISILISSAESGYLKFTIKDAGLNQGIVENNLFAHFTGKKFQTDRKYGKSGLGITIADGLVKMMGGEIKISSEPGTDIILNFTLNLENQPDKVEQSLASFVNKEASSYLKTVPEQIKYELGDSLKGKKILVVDDNYTNQEIALAILETAGVRVMLASNGREAVNLVREEQFAAVLMDVQMPEMDGYEATRTIRKQKCFSRLPILALTAHTSKEEQDKCLKVGMDGFISKPISQKNMLSILEEFLSPEPGLPDNGAPAQVTDAVRNYGTEFTESCNKNHKQDKTIPPQAQVNRLIIDTSLARQRLGISEEIYKKILKKFFVSNKDICKKIDTAFANNEIQTVRKTAHMLKGSAGSIGAVYLLIRCK